MTFKKLQPTYYISTELVFFYFNIKMNCCINAREASLTPSVFDLRCCTGSQFFPQTVFAEFSLFIILYIHCISSPVYHVLYIGLKENTSILFYSINLARRQLFKEWIEK
jgi:hypothetical protein